MLPYTPNLAARLRPGWPIAVALALGLGLVGDATRRAPAPEVAIACPVVVRTVVSATPAANLVGIYRSATCTLTLDASGTYVSDCGRGHADRYETSGDVVVLEQIGGAQRLTILSGGRLMAADGTSYSTTGATR